MGEDEKFTPKEDWAVDEVPGFGPRRLGEMPSGDEAMMMDMGNLSDVMEMVMNDKALMDIAMAMVNDETCATSCAHFALQHYAT